MTCGLDDLICIGCNKKPDELTCYTAYAADDGLSNAQYVMLEEGTLNRENGHFLCDDCYVKAGMPAGTNGRRWVAP